jgi:peptidoglycan/LPS O-acetylase OafA/YrhL
VSYGIYLWHQFVKDRYISWTGTRLFAGGVVPMLVWVFVLTTVIAAASWFAVERPALSRRDRPAAGTPTG